MREFLEQINHTDLLDFIETYSNKDENFAKALRVRFAEPDFMKEISYFRTSVERAVGGAHNYHDRGGWGYIELDTNRLYNEINTRKDQGHIKMAFAETELLYRELLKNFEFQDECEVSDEAEYCVEIMSQIADAAGEQDRGYIFERCLELTALEDGKDYGADYEDKLLAIALKFVTAKNHTALEQAIVNLEQYGWNKERFKLLHLSVIQNLDGQSAANAFVYDNLQFPKIRAIAFDAAMQQADYPEAERLCKDALEQGDDSRGVSPWLHRLYSVYETAGDSKLSEIAEEILLKGDLSYYDKLKEVLSQLGQWDTQYTHLLKKIESRLSAFGYMEILAKEYEHEKLLAVLEHNAGYIYKFGDVLATEYRNEVKDIFIKQISHEAELANNRMGYNAVCKNIAKFAESGYVEAALELSGKFMSIYRRRPAFVDELTKMVKNTKNH